MKIIDCFIFYNEISMLKYRIRTLSPLVDFFVLVEATKTHSGNDKPLYYQENKHLFTAEEQAKIIHLVCDELEHKDAWVNENKQRNYIIEAFASLQMNPDDIIFISDLDEIPNPKLLENLRLKKVRLDPTSLYAMQMDMYYYNLRHCQKTEIWQRAKLMTFSFFRVLKKDEITKLTRMAQNYVVFVKAGWHLSYFGDARFISNKIQQFAHQEFNKNEFTDPVEIEKKVTGGHDLFNRPNAIEIIELCDNPFLPPLDGLEEF